MIRRSTIIFAASLALLSTFEPTICFAAAAPAPNRDELERPRFLKREIKRFHPRGANTTTTVAPVVPPPAVVGVSTSDLETLSESLITTPQKSPDTTTTSIPVTSSQHTTNPLTQSITQTSSAIPNIDTKTPSSQQSSSAATQSSVHTSTPAGLLPSITLPSETTLSTPSVTVPSVTLPLLNGATQSQSSAKVVPSTTTTNPTLGNGNQSPVVGPTSLSISLPGDANPAGDSPSSVAGATPPKTETSNPANKANPGILSTSVVPLGIIPTLSVPLPSLPIVQTSTNPQPVSLPVSLHGSSAATATDTTALGSDAATQTTTRAGAVSVQSPSSSIAPMPTGPALFNALTSALGPNVAPSSSMLPNGNIVPIVSNIASNVGAGVNTIASNAEEGVNTVVSNAGANVNALTSNVGGAISTAVSNIGAGAKSITSNAGEGVNTVVSNVGGAVSSGVSNAGVGISSVVSNAEGGINTISSNVGAGVSSIVSNAEGGINTISSNVGAGVSSLTSKAGEGINTVVSNIGGAVSSGVSLVGASVNSIVSNAEGSINTALSDVQASITSLNGELTAMPSQTASAPSIPAATDSNGHVVSNTAAASNTVTAPIIPVLTDTLGSIISGATAAAGSAISALTTNSLGQAVSIPTALTSIPAVTSVPIATDQIPGVTLTPPASSLSMPSAPVVPVSTQSNINLVPNPLATSNTALPPLVPATTDGKGNVIPNPSDATNTALAPITPSTKAVMESATAPVTSGATMSNSAPAGQPSATLSNGAVVPLETKSDALTGTPVLGSQTLSNGAVVPITAAPASTTLPNGSVLPVSNAANPASTTLPNGSIVPVSNVANPASTTPPNGSVVPVASVQASVTGTPGTQAPGATNAISTPGPQPLVSAAQTFPTDAKGPFTQQPTGSDTATAQSVPSQILVQSSIPSIVGGSSSSNAATGLPTGVPLVLYPPSGLVKQPENTDMIQIGFKQPLNYDFVWTHDKSQQQIFKFLPLGISYGLNIEISNVTMQTLRAWDTTQDLHYITTLAIAWIPSGLVDTLGLLVQTHTSRFYNNPDSSTNTLLSMINNALPIAANNSTDGMEAPYGAMPTSTTSVKTNGAPIGGSIGASAPVKPSAVGIGVGITCGAAVYGAAMFVVARRYKKRRKSHSRSPSMFSSPVMSHTGPDAGAGAALMSGGIDRSVSPYHDEDGRAGSRGSGRSGSTGRQQISAPVMAENSLGWN